MEKRIPEEATETLGPLSPDEIVWAQHRPGTMLADRFRLIRRIGSGGYATVYLAEDELLRRNVALKILHTHRIGGHGLARMRREVLVAREVDSPRLVRIHDLVVADEAAFLTMEWVPGESLKERIEREGPLEIEEALRIGGEILQGLAALHERGILHRDVKPSNVLLTEDGSVRLADFGLAWRWEGGDTRITATEAVVGTAEYLAPEQIRGERIGVPADLYAFGITLYEMLTGAPAFGKVTSFQTILARLEAGPARPRRDRGQVPPWLEQVALRLLERRPEDRFASASEVLAALESHSSSWLTPRRRRQTWRGVAATALGLLATVLLLAYLRQAPPRFSHVGPLAHGEGLRGLATDGSELWSREGYRGDLQLARLRPGEPPRLVGFLAPLARVREPALEHRLQIVDPESGDMLRSVDLPQGGPVFFREFANRFSPVLSADDIDGDGGDEILVTYRHMYWPSYTVLYEPRIDRSRIIFAAGGHQRPQTFVDLTGDGKEEVVFFGWANRLGYVMGAAAVEIDPWINEDPAHSAQSPAHTPDPDLWRHQNESLVWYELLPSDACLGDQTKCVEAADRELHFVRRHKPQIRLDFHGFRSDLSSELSPAERQQQRFRVYELAAEARLLWKTGSPEAALRSVNQAEAIARRVVDPGLEEYAGRVGAMLLARLGRSQAAEKRFLDLYESSELPPNVAFDAAEAFHLAGVLDRALAWYRRVFDSNPAGNSGRPRRETLSGLSLCLLEMGAPEEALRELERLGGASPEFVTVRPLQTTVRWLAGLPFEPPETDRGQTDLMRYLVLELQLAGGRSPEDLGRLAAEDLERTSNTRGLLLSLHGETLRRDGDLQRAVPLTREGFEIASDEAGRATHYRAFLPLVAARYARALEEVGDKREAERIRAELVDEKNPLVKVALGAGEEATSRSIGSHG